MSLHFPVVPLGDYIESIWVHLRISGLKWGGCSWESLAGMQLFRDLGQEKGGGLEKEVVWERPGERKGLEKEVVWERPGERNLHTSTRCDR